MPIVNGQEDEFENITFTYLNVLEGDNEVVQRTLYNLRGHPSWALVNEDGVIVERGNGGVSAESLRTKLSAINP